LVQRLNVASSDLRMTNHARNGRGYGYVTHFWATVSKTVRPMLSDRCLSVCPVCDVGVLWPNGWMDRDETWHGGSPRPRPHCIRWRPTSPSPKGHSPQFSAHVCFGQTADWIKMPLGSAVGLGPGHIVSDGDPSPPNFRPCLL